MFVRSHQNCSCFVDFLSKSNMCVYNSVENIPIKNVEISAAGNDYSSQRKHKPSQFTL